jgi:site-specific DNA recombinase
MIVVYKIDRLTRSLADFARLVERLDSKGCSFVSVTQAFNTSSSMGRLTLNVLLSFAQFEREVTAERIRDKIAASKRKGLWMGGALPLGYDPPQDPLKARVLQINPIEAETVRQIFGLYARLGTLTATRLAATERGLSPRKADHQSDKLNGDLITSIAPFSNGQLQYFLTNPVYRGQIRHKALVHPGQHEAIISDELWSKVQAKLQSKAARKRGSGSSISEQDTPSITSVTSGEPSSPLTGKIFDETGDRLTPSHTNRHNRRFRYYVSRRLITQGLDPTGWRLPAQQLEALVLTALRQHLQLRVDRHDLMTTPDAKDAASLSGALGGLLASKGDAALWPLIAEINLTKGTLRITLATEELAAALNIRPEALNCALTTFEYPFQLRRRGVETRLVSSRPEPLPDPVLQQNLARAHRWAKALRGGQSLTKLAKSEGCSESSLRSRLMLAFLAPSIQRAIIDGTIAPEWTTDRLLRQNLSADWLQQANCLDL